MNLKKIGATLLTVSTLMSFSVYAAPLADDVTIIEDDAVITDAQTVKVVEEEVELVINGQVGTVIVTEAGEESEILVNKGASVNKILVESEETEVEVLKDASVGTIVLNGEDAEVEGEGTVGTVTANSDECEIDVPNTKVVVGENASDVEAGDVELNPGDIVVINPNGEGVTPWEPAPEVPDVPTEAHEVVLSVLNSSPITKGQAIQIRCNGTHENGACDFMAQITGVVITAPNGKTDNVMPNGVESVFEEIGYTVDTTPNSLTIGKDTLNQAFAQDENGKFIPGDYTIALTAENYSEKTVSINVADTQPDPEKPDVTLPAPEVADVASEKSITGNSYKVSFNAFEGITDYLNAVSEITLNGNPAKKVTNLFNETNAFKLDVINDAQSVFAYDCISFTPDCFQGKVDVVIQANGYEDLTFTVQDGELVLPVVAAPAVDQIVYKTQFMGGNYYNVSFVGGEDVVASFVAAINNVTVNGEKVAPVATFFNDTMSYKTSNDPAFGGKDQFVDFTEDCFKGEKTVVISADGYQDLTFQVKDGKLVPPAVSAPAVDQIVYKTQFMGGNYYNVSFVGGEDVVASFVAAINNVTVNGEKVAPVATFFNDTMSYKTSNDPAFGGKDQFIDFTEDCFKGEKTVVISADGYQDLTFQVQDGKLL